MPVTNVPNPPLRSQGKTQAQYSTEFEAFMVALPLAIADLNAVGSAYALATNATSTTSNTVTTGSKSFTTQLNLGYQVGQTIRIAANSTNYLTGEVTSYSTSTGALVVNVTAVVGTGTFTSWFLSQAAVGANNAAGVSFAPTGNIAATNVQAALVELDSEKLSNAAGAVTGTNLEDITTAETVGSSFVIPVVTKDVNGRVTSMATAPKISRQTVIATTSGTSHSFAIPVGATKITVMLDSVSTNGTSNLILQLGVGGTPETTGYSGTIQNVTGGAVGGTTQTAGIFLTNGNAAAAGAIVGHCFISNITGNTWIGSTNTSLTAASGVGSSFGSFTKTLAGLCNFIRLTTVNGTDTFDAGSINILVE
jgi:hypothetical protein